MLQTGEPVTGPDRISAPRYRGGVRVEPGLFFCVGPAADAVSDPPNRPRRLFLQVHPEPVRGRRAWTVRRLKRQLFPEPGIVSIDPVPHPDPNAGRFVPIVERHLIRTGLHTGPDKAVGRNLHVSQTDHECRKVKRAARARKPILHLQIPTLPFQTKGAVL